ncbi:retropepsin-like aspartic protease [Sphingomonas radiodurans]|uniref:retropepsin-like aspartic protease n=1 Tax=Sphingomonas radiodurans TaxID=2890321 RepID=UPI001E4F2213|nr:retropepsin-like aspartic protease [Sphingomonas radiodurans]WBH15732.1 retropepsin-like aspartic protease [Sphingomonas radiodurans]
MNRWLALPLLLLAANTADPQPVPAPVPITEPELVSLADQFAFGHNGARMTVPVQIAGAGPYEFIIDTGAQRTVISRELAGKLGLAGGRTVRLTGMTGTENVGTVIIPSISVSTLGGERIEAPALSAVHLGAPGMLGIDALQGHALAIDFDNQRMTVSPARRRGQTVRRAPDEIVIQAKSLFGQLVVTDARVNGQRVRVILDTGSAVTMGNMALRNRLARRSKVVPISLISVTGGELTADYGSIKSIEIGSISINDMPIAFADVPPFRVFGLEKKPAIMLGMDTLKLFTRVQIDFANRELRLSLPRNMRRG